VWYWSAIYTKLAVVFPLQPRFSCIPCYNVLHKIKFTLQQAMNT